MHRLFLLIVLLPASAFAQHWPLLDEAPGAEHTVATWSIIARDEATGQIGIAVQSRAFRAGRTVPYAEPGVGLVATQAGAANTNYGKKAMAMLREGMAPQAIVDRLVKEDPTPGGRQVAVIDSQGRIAVYRPELRCLGRSQDRRPIFSAAQHPGRTAGCRGDVQGISGREG